MHAVLQEILSAQITVKEGDENRTNDQQTALFKSIVARAIKGDMRAAALVKRLMDNPNQTGAAASGITKIIREIVHPPKRE